MYGEKQVKQEANTCMRMYVHEAVLLHASRGGLPCVRVLERNVGTKREGSENQRVGQGVDQLEGSGSSVSDGIPGAVAAAARIRIRTQPVPRTRKLGDRPRWPLIYLSDRRNPREGAARFVRELFTDGQRRHAHNPRPANPSSHPWGLTCTRGR